MLLLYATGANDLQSNEV